MEKPKKVKPLMAGIIIMVSGITAVVVYFCFLGDDPHLGTHILSLAMSTIAAFIVLCGSWYLLDNDFKQHSNQILKHYRLKINKVVLCSTLSVISAIGALILTYVYVNKKLAIFLPLITAVLLILFYSLKYNSEKIRKFFQDVFKHGSVKEWLLYMLFVTLVGILTGHRWFKLDVVILTNSVPFTCSLTYFLICYFRKRRARINELRGLIYSPKYRDPECALWHLYLNDKISRNELLREHAITTGDFPLYRLFTYARGIYHVLFHFD